MSSTSSGHLTDDQFAQCVIAASGPETEAHLHDCFRCREELTRFSASMEDFGRAAAGWSEAQPSVSLRTARRSQPTLSWAAPAGWALAAGLLLAAGLPVALHYQRQPVAASDAAQDTVSNDSDEQIAEDNQLMRSVNMAIGTNDSPLLQEYGLQTGQHARLKQVSALRNE